MLNKAYVAGFVRCLGIGPRKKKKEYIYIYIGEACLFRWGVAVFAVKLYEWWRNIYGTWGRTDGSGWGRGVLFCDYSRVKRQPIAPSCRVRFTVARRNAVPSFMFMFMGDGWGRGFPPFTRQEGTSASRQGQQLHHGCPEARTTKATFHRRRVYTVLLYCNCSWKEIWRYFCLHRVSERNLFNSCFHRLLTKASTFDRSSEW